MPRGGVRVTVVGAGIAGLATAIALRRRGVEVEVVERAHALTEIGAALSLWPNAIAALDELGLAETVLATGCAEVSGVLRSLSGAVLARADEAELRRALGGPTIAIHRADLQRILLEAASDIPVRLGARCRDVTLRDQAVIARLDDGSEITADALVGCDGAHSAVRASVFGPARLVYAGGTTWRAVVEAVWLTESSLSIGDGKQLLVSPIGGGRVYWAASDNLPEGVNDSIPAALPFIAEAFRGWKAPIARLLELSSEDRVVRADVHERRPPLTMARGAVALAGDAAHAMTPDLGQGACQALEDAVILSVCLERHGDPAPAFAAYQSIRMPRVEAIVRDSRRLGRLVTTANPALAVVRDLGLRLTPHSPRLRRLATYGSRQAFSRCLAAARR